MIYQEIQDILQSTMIPDYKKPKKVFTLLNLATRKEDTTLLPHLHEFEKYYIIERASRDKNLLSNAIIQSNIPYIKKLLESSVYSEDNQDRNDIKTLLDQAMSLGKNKCFELIFNHYQNKIDVPMLCTLIIGNNNAKISEFIVHEKHYDIPAQYVSTLTEKKLFREKLAQLDKNEQIELIKILTDGVIRNRVYLNSSLSDTMTCENKAQYLIDDYLVFHGKPEAMMDSLITAIKFCENKDYVNTRLVQETDFFSSFKKTLFLSIEKHNYENLYGQEKINKFHVQKNMDYLQKFIDIIEKRLNKYHEIMKATAYHIFPLEEKMQIYLPFAEKYRINQILHTNEEKKEAKKRVKI